MNVREMIRQTSAKRKKKTQKHKLGNRTNRWSKVQADTRCPSSKMQRFNIQTTNLSEEFRFNQSVYTFRNIP